MIVSNTGALQDSYKALTFASHLPVLTNLPLFESFQTFVQAAKDENFRILLILDDVQQNLLQSKSLEQYIRQGRHLNLNILLILHNIVHIPINTRQEFDLCFVLQSKLPTDQLVAIKGLTARFETFSQHLNSIQFVDNLRYCIYIPKSSRHTNYDIFIIENTKKKATGLIALKSLTKFYEEGAFKKISQPKQVELVVDEQVTGEHVVQKTQKRRHTKSTSLRTKKLCKSVQ